MVAPLTQTIFLRQCIDRHWTLWPYTYTNLMHYGLTFIEDSGSFNGTELIVPLDTVLGK